MQLVSGWFPVGQKADYTFSWVEAAGAAKVVQAGGKVGMGTDGLFSGLGNHWEIRAHVLGGMSAYDALRSATLSMGGRNSIALDRGAQISGV